ncbi:TPA: quinolinate synthase NadA [Candidatus Poribacteria bacterium]|nr:quinolinate synthase NadA [Candidatus Poribacteria bacterium]
MRPLMPDRYRQVSDHESIERIKARKLELGRRLVLLGHHYQRQEIVELSDFRGDSLGLSRDAAKQKDAEFIVFCGVHFMAESAEILSQPQQIVQLPDLTAGCPMADMADIFQVESAWREIDKVCGGENVTPITYVNSSAELKAFCGRNDGVVCTSSNAGSVFDWGFEKTDKLFFFPDEHLGRNTANKKGIQKDKVIVWNPEEEMGGNTRKQIRDADVILWKGYCHVHTFFKLVHVLEIREKYPEAIIIVHPECVEEVVDMADADGSTGFIVQFVQEAKSGSTIVIGTEINLVNRLAREHPDKKIFELARSLCPNMYKINLRNLLWTLDNIGEINIVTVPKQIKVEAKVALERMLEII